MLCLRNVTRTSLLKRCINRPLAAPQFRLLYASAPRRRPEAPTVFTNILAGDTPPPVQVSSVSADGIQLSDGLIISSSCIFVEGKVLLWDVPLGADLWSKWRKEHLEVFEVVVPRPEILLLGTGERISMPPPFIRTYLNTLGIQLDIMDTRNACSTYNLLAEEGRRVAAALLPYHSQAWSKTKA